MKEIDFQLTAQDVRYPVYEYMELDGGEWAKFEQFLAGKTNFQGLQDQFKEPFVYEEIVRNIARLHSAEGREKSYFDLFLEIQNYLQKLLI